MNFEEQLRRYAKLIVEVGLNVQPGQLVNIRGELIHRPLACFIGQEAYRRGAKFVMLDLAEPSLKVARIEQLSVEELSYLPQFVSTKYRELVDTTAANVAILGEEFPGYLSELDPKKINAERMAFYREAKYFYQEGIGKSKVHWTVVAGATPGWAKRMYPNVSESEALQRFWDEIFRICRLDTGDAVERWRAHDALLHARAKKLTELNITNLHFRGPGTDLHVGLSPRAIFRGGSDMSPRGVPFQANVPTEECFTTPDWRKTHGKVRTTRPFLINGKMIKGLTLEFKEGRISSFSADQGAEMFSTYIASDEGGNRLGEVALVGTDSPIFQSGLVYEEILFDENAACHIAIGSAYKFCINGADSLSADELDKIGCNESSVHTDMMISSEEVDVIATTSSGAVVPLLEKGSWKEF